MKHRIKYIACTLLVLTYAFGCGNTAMMAQKYIKNIYERELGGGFIEQDYQSRGIDRTGWENELNIQTSLAELHKAYQTNGVLPLRPLSHEKLIIGCGNRRRVREGQWAGSMCIRNHRDADTVNVDPHYDPTIVATFDFDNRGTNHLNSGTGSLVLPSQRYNEIISEAGGGLQGLNEIARILRPGGLYFVYGSALRAQVLNLPQKLKIILVTGGSSGNLTSREEYEESFRWRQFERDTFLNRIESDPNRSYSFVIAKQREDGSFPSEAPEYMRSYLQDSWTATE